MKRVTVCTPAAGAGLLLAGRSVCSLLVPDTPPASRSGKAAIITPGHIISTAVTHLACAVQSSGVSPGRSLSGEGVCSLHASRTSSRCHLAAGNGADAFKEPDPPARCAFSHALSSGH